MRNNKKHDPNCELCRREKATQTYYEDEIMWIADCADCRVPMVVLKSHKAVPTEMEHARMRTELRKVANMVFGQGKYTITTTPRKIPEHAHYHARPKLL